MSIRQENRAADLRPPQNSQSTANFLDKLGLFDRAELYRQLEPPSVKQVQDAPTLQQTTQPGGYYGEHDYYGFVETQQSLANQHSVQGENWDCEPIDAHPEDYLRVPDDLDEDWSGGLRNTNPTPKNASRAQTAPKGQSKEPTAEVPLPTQDSLNAFV